MDIFEVSKQHQQTARQVIEEINIIPIWESIGAKVNLVGSVKTGLMMKNKDIDLHIYTNQLIISDSFSAMKQLAENPGIKDIQYKNLIHTQEACIEWHAWYEDTNHNHWKLDMIHILKGSLYDGVVEKVTDSIIRKLTPELKRNILQIKSEIPHGVIIPGIEIYYAVFSYNISTYKEFVEWKKNAPIVNYLEWMPE